MDTKNVTHGHWLGIDVGSARSKVFNFCLIKSDGKGRIDVLFEVGKARFAFPRSDARSFTNLGRPTWLSEAAESGAVQILDNSALVKTWKAAHELGHGTLGVCVDAPCGLAAPGFDRRNTESQLVNSFVTPTLAVFLEDLKRFSAEGKDDPLRQRFFWKLIGLVAFRYFATLATTQPFDMPIEELTALCMVSEKPCVREGFPSDTYKRSNGQVGVLGPASRALLLRLTQARWAGHGNYLNSIQSAPHPDRMSALLAHQRRLLEDLRREDSRGIRSMRKIPDNPAWADLWDAFTCAFVSCCDAQGCGGFVCSEIPRGRQEGAILRPDYVLEVQSTEPTGRVQATASRAPIRSSVLPEAAPGTSSSRVDIRRQAMSDDEVLAIAREKVRQLEADIAARKGIGSRVKGRPIGEPGLLTQLTLKLLRLLRSPSQ